MSLFLNRLATCKIDSLLKASHLATCVIDSSLKKIPSCYLQNRLLLKTSCCYENCQANVAAGTRVFFQSISFMSLPKPLAARLSSCRISAPQAAGFCWDLFSKVHKKSRVGSVTTRLYTSGTRRALSVSRSQPNRDV